MEQTTILLPDLDGEARYEVILKRDAPNCVITHKARKLVVCAQMPIRLKERKFGVLSSGKNHARPLSFHVSMLLASEKRDGNRFRLQKEIATSC